MNYLLPERLDALAREYATGTLAGGARRRFERLLREQRAAQLAVAVWQQRLVVLADGVPRVAPSPAVWSALQQRLFGAGTAARTAPAAREPWWRTLGATLFGTRALGGALAGVLLAVVVLRQQPDWLGHETYREALPASYVGLLTDGTGKPTVLASSRRHGRTLTVKLLQPLAVPPGKVAQLWALPKDGKPAFPVGTLPASGSGTVALADSSEKLFFTVDRLAVSLEATPAAAGAAPAEPYLLSGHCVKLW